MHFKKAYSTSASSTSYSSFLSSSSSSSPSSRNQLYISVTLFSTTTTKTTSGTGLLLLLLYPHTTLCDSKLTLSAPYKWCLSVIWLFVVAAAAAVTSRLLCVCLPLDLLALFLFSPFLSVLSSLAPSQTKPSSLFDMTPKKVIYLFLCLSVCPLLSGGFLCPRPVQFSSVQCSGSQCLCSTQFVVECHSLSPSSKYSPFFLFSQTMSARNRSRNLFLPLLLICIFIRSTVRTDSPPPPTQVFSASSSSSSSFRMLIYLVQSMTTMMMRMKRKVPLFILLA